MDFEKICPFPEKASDVGPLHTQNLRETGLEVLVYLGWEEQIKIERAERPVNALCENNWVFLFRSVVGPLRSLLQGMV